MDVSNTCYVLGPYTDLCILTSVHVQCKGSPLKFLQSPCCNGYADCEQSINRKNGYTIMLCGVNA